LGINATRENAGTCSVNSGTNGWIVGPGASGFAYSTPGFNGISFGNVSFSLANVPEPGSLGLFGFGLVLLLGVAARRRLALRRAG